MRLLPPPHADEIERRDNEHDSDEHYPLKKKRLPVNPQDNSQRDERGLHEARLPPRERERLEYIHPPILSQKIYICLLPCGMC